MHASLCAFMFFCFAENNMDHPMRKGDPNFLIEALAFEDDGVSEIADQLVVLGQKNDEVVRLLIKSLKHMNRDVRYYSASILGRIGEPKAEAAVEELFCLMKNKNDDEGVRSIAANALGLLGAASVPLLSKAMKDDDDFVRISGASALGRVGSIGSKRMECKNAIAVLCEAINDQHADVRSVATESLGRFVVAAARPLRECLKSSNAYQRVYGAEALLIIEPNSVTDVLPILFDGLKDSNTNVRAQAARAFGRCGSQGKRGIRALLKTLGDPQPKVRMAAGSALSMYMDDIGPGMKDTVPFVVKSLEDDEDLLRDLAATVLGKIGADAKDAVPALIKALEKELNDVVRCGIIQTFGQIGPEAKEAIPVLVKMMDNPMTNKVIICEALERLKK